MGLWNWLIGKKKASTKKEALPEKKEKASTRLEDLLEYLEAGRPATFNCNADASKLNRIIQYYEEYASTKQAPRLTFYVLTGTSKQGSEFPVVVVKTGDLFEHHKEYRFNLEIIRELVIPGKNWSDLWGEGGEARSNFASPGCDLSSTDRFDAMVEAIIEGSYDVIRVLSPSDKSKEPISKKQASGTAPFAAENYCQCCSKDMGLQWHYEFESIVLAKIVGLKCQDCGLIRCIDHGIPGSELETCPDCRTSLVLMMEGPADSSMVEGARSDDRYHGAIKEPSADGRPVERG